MIMKYTLQNQLDTPMDDGRYYKGFHMPHFAKKIGKVATRSFKDVTGITEKERAAKQMEKAEAEAKRAAAEQGKIREKAAAEQARVDEITDATTTRDNVKRKKRTNRSTGGGMLSSGDQGVTGLLATK